MMLYGEERPWLLLLFDLEFLMIFFFFGRMIENHLNSFKQTTKTLPWRQLNLLRTTQQYLIPGKRWLLLYIICPTLLLTFSRNLCIHHLCINFTWRILQIVIHLHLLNLNQFLKASCSKRYFHHGVGNTSTYIISLEITNHTQNNSQSSSFLTLLRLLNSWSFLLIILI